MAKQVWSGRALGWRRALVASAAAGVCFAGAAGVNGLLAGARGLLLVVGLVVVGGLILVWAAAMVHVGVRMTAYSLQVRHGLIPVSVADLPLRCIRSATVAEVTPSVGRRWGWTWQPGRGRTVVVRSGPALAVEFGAGQRLLVSIDDPETAVDMFHRLRGTTRTPS